MTYQEIKDIYGVGTILIEYGLFTYVTVVGEDEVFTCALHNPNYEFNNYLRAPIRTAYEILEEKTGQPVVAMAGATPCHVHQYHEASCAECHLELAGKIHAIQMQSSTPCHHNIIGHCFDCESEFVASIRDSNNKALFGIGEVQYVGTVVLNLEPDCKCVSPAAHENDCLWVVWRNGDK